MLQNIFASLLSVLLKEYFLEATTSLTQGGINAVLQRNTGHGCAGLFNQLQELAFEDSAMSALCGDDGR